MAQPKYNRTIVVLQQLAQEALHAALDLAEDVRDGKVEPELLDAALADADAALALVPLVEFLEIDPAGDLVEQAVARARTRPRRKRAAPEQLPLVPVGSGSSSGSGLKN